MVGYETDKASKGSEEGRNSGRSTLKSPDKFSSMLRKGIKKLWKYVLLWTIIHLNVQTIEAYSIAIALLSW